MNDTLLSRFRDILADPSAVPSAADVAMLEAAYPYFTLPAAVRLRRCADLAPAERERLQQRVAVSGSDNEAIVALVDPEGSFFASFYPPAKEKKPTTADAISTFLDNFGGRDPHEDALLEKLIFHPVAEYAVTLGREENATEETVPKSRQDEMLDEFMKKYAPDDATRRDRSAHADKPRKSPRASAPADSPLSESLAKIYIGRGRYDKAYEIIHNLSLNFPKKSIYFADQLRFLQKLMLVSKFKEK